MTQALNRPLVLTTQVGHHTITLETGRLAKQAHGSVLVTCGDNMVLVTAVTGAHRPDAPFFPLVVDYVEKQYAGGRVPGGFLKREGRLSDPEILVCRLTDRPIRPQFPDGYKGDTQIIATVLSHDGRLGCDVLAMSGASAALMLSPAPFDAPIAGVRVGRVQGTWIANPDRAQQAASDVNIVMACSQDAIVMVEGECDEISEQDLLDALDFGFQSVQGLLQIQVELAARAGHPKTPWQRTPPDPALVELVRAAATAPLQHALFVREKAARYAEVAAVKKQVVALVTEQLPDQLGDLSWVFDELKSEVVRERILSEQTRIDGRRPDEIRRIETEVGTLPRPHGSALFTRGETQALVTVTLGTDRDGKLQDGLFGKYDEKFMLHYNFPPFSTGEVKPLRGVGRRELGHGYLAQRALERVLPPYEKFPYVVRVVSEVLESNGSSSMASVCGGSMALMHAGVPLRAPVAGIAMGLIMDETGRHAVLSDILGDEDHLGDMDFKVCGTHRGITALQMDIKVRGLSRDIMASALGQARQGRLHILGCMEKTIREANAELSEYAPRITTIRIAQDRIRDVIGSGGKTIRSIQERTGCSVDISDDGTVKVASSDRAAAQQAVDIIRSLTAEPALGEVYLGVVAKVAEFGAFVTILPGVDGLCHISELSEERVDRTDDVVREGDEIIVKCVGIEGNGKIRLSRKEALGKVPTVGVQRVTV
jgi:polyribonucleotide nucleotidyltransferase